MGRINSPIAHYKMNDDAASTVVVDTGTGGNNGTCDVNTDTISVTGKINEALELDGSTSIEVPSFNDISTGKTSAFVWAKKTTDGQGNILSHYDHGINQRSWVIHTGAHPSTFDDKIRFRFSEDGLGTTKEWKTNDAILADDEWHHIGFTWEDGSPDGVLKIYVDGLEYTDLTKSTDNDLASLHQSTQKIGIGTAFYNNNADQRFEGSIDDVRIYNEALTIQEIAAIYNKGHGTEEETPPIDYSAGAKKNISGTIQEVLNKLQAENIISEKVASWTDNGTDATVTFIK